MRPVDSIIKPLTPRVGRWEEWFVPDHLQAAGFPARRFYSPTIGAQVISAVEVVVDAPGMQPKGPEYHLSISLVSANGVRRISSADAQMVLIQFGADGAKEDNHVPSGKVRNYWRPVAEPDIGKVCACQADEPEIREDKGDYIWRPAP